MKNNKKELEIEKKLSMTRELKFKELQEKIDEEESDRIVEEAIKKSKKAKRNITSDLEKEIDELLEVETKKKRKIKPIENVEEELPELLEDNKKVKKTSKSKDKKEDNDDVKITKITPEEDLYLTSSFKPLKSKMNVIKILKFIFKLVFIVCLLGLFIYFILLPIYKMVEDSKPKAVFDNTLDYIQKQVSMLTADELLNDKDIYSVEMSFGLDTNIKDLEFLKDYSYTLSTKYDVIKNKSQTDVYVSGEDNKKYGITYIEKDNMSYSKYTTSDIFLKEDLVLEEDSVVSLSDYNYYVSKIITVLKEVIKEEDLVASREELEIDGFTTRVIRNSLELNKDKIIEYEKEISKRLLKDEEFLKIESLINKVSLEETKESYKEERTYEDDYILTINIYTTKGTQVVGFDIEKNGFRNIYFYRYDKKFEGHLNMTTDEECLNGGDCVASSRMVIDIIGTTKNNTTKVDIILNDEDIGYINIKEFSDKKISLDYNIIISDIRFQGDLYYEYIEKDNKYDVSFSLEFDDEYLRINAGLAFDFKEFEIEYIDPSKVYDYTDKLFDQETDKFYDIAKQAGVEDVVDLYFGITDMLIGTEVEESNSSSI